MAEGFFIGEFARRSGTTPKTVRYYEDLGLLEGAPRTASGYRLYHEADVERLRFILGAKALGLSLDEIKAIVGLWHTGTRPCARVSQLLDAKLAALDRRIEELITFRDALRAYKLDVDAQAVRPDTPCAHIDGVTRGRWASGLESAAHLTFTPTGRNTITASSEERTHEAL